MTKTLKYTRYTPIFYCFPSSALARQIEMSSDDDDVSDQDLFNALLFDDEDLNQLHVDDLLETEVDPVFGLIKDERERDRQGSQMGIRIEKAAMRMHLRTHVHTCMVRFNPNNNTFYFCTAGEGNYQRHRLRSPSSKRMS